MNIVQELATEIESLFNQYQSSHSIAWLVTQALRSVGVEKTTVLRRDFDGCSEAEYLCRKMIGELLIIESINR